MLFTDTYGLVSICIVYFCYFSMSYITVTTGFIPLYSYSELISSIFIILVFLSLSCHMTAMLIDPGTITSSTSSLTQVGIPCGVCECTKPPRAHHCNTCNKCILNMDHHCPWINNCVGFKNQKHFILFLVYTLILCAWILFTLTHRIILCQTQECFGSENPFDAILIMFCYFGCLFFAFLVFVSLQEQMRVIKTNISQIDVLQLRRFKQVRFI